MKVVFLLIFLSLMLSTYSQEEYIVWDEANLLEWTDFKGEFEDTGKIAQAKTTYKIEIQPLEVLVDEKDNIQNYMDMGVETRFYPKLSWVRDKNDFNVITKNLLVHEQLHFDIAELYARKMRYEFSKLKENNISNFDAYQNVWTRLWKECRAVQKDYDSDTNHGIKDDESIAWEVRVKAQLKTYTTFSKK